MSETDLLNDAGMIPLVPAESIIYNEILFETEAALIDRAIAFTLVREPRLFGPRLWNWDFPC